MILVGMVRRNLKALVFYFRGANSPRGEGILRIWSSFDAYIADENSQGVGTSKRGQPMLMAIKSLIVRLCWY